MNGTPQKIEITDYLIQKVAEKRFSNCNKDTLNEQLIQIRHDWFDDTKKMLKNFNATVTLFKDTNITCDFE